MRLRLSSILVKEGFLSVQALKNALALQVIKGGLLDTVLLENNLVPEATLLTLLGRLTGYSTLKPTHLTELDQEMVQIIDLETAERLHLCPAKSTADALTLLVSEEVDHVALEELAFELNRRLSIVVAPEVRLLQARRDIYTIPIPPRFELLIGKLGLFPPPATPIQSSEGQEGYLVLKPLIEPRREEAPKITSAPEAQALDAGAPATLPERDLEPIGEEKPAEIKEDIFNVLGPLSAEADKEGLPQEPPKKITDSYPPIRERHLRRHPEGTEPEPPPRAPEDVPLTDAGQAVPEMPPIPADAEMGEPTEEDVLLADHELLPDHSGELPERILEESQAYFIKGEIAVPGELQPQPEDDSRITERDLPVVQPDLETEESAPPLANVPTLEIPPPLFSTQTLETPLPPISAQLEEPFALSFEDAIITIHKAQDRDALLLALLRGVHPYLGCVQMYVLKEGLLQGYLELTSERLNREEIRSRKLSLIVPSVVSRAVGDGSLYIGPVPDTDDSASVFLSAGILSTKSIVLVPVLIKKKTACLLVGHDYDRPIPPRHRMTFARLGEEAGLALGRLILRQKQTRHSQEFPRSTSPIVEPAPSGPELEVTEKIVIPEEHVTPYHPDETTAPSGEPPEKTEHPGSSAADQGIEPGSAPEDSSEPPVSRRYIPNGGYAFDSVRSIEGEQAGEGDSNALQYTPAAAGGVSSPEGRSALAAIPALLDELDKGGSAAEWAEEELRKLGAPAIQAIIARFPGRLRFDRLAPHSHLPPVSECSPELKALASYGRPILFSLAPLFHHRDIEVRFYATYLLSELIFPETVTFLAGQLQDTEPEIRKIAARTLSRFRRMEQFPAVLEDLRSDLQNPNQRPRKAAIEALAALGDGASVPRLIDLLLDPDLGIIEAASNALVILTKQDYAGNEKRWSAWWEQNKDLHRIEWLIEGLVHKAPEIRAAAAVELEHITGLTYGYSFDMARKDRESVRKRFMDWWIEEGIPKFSR